jgi:hypothetical protein
MLEAEGGGSGVVSPTRVTISDGGDDGRLEARLVKRHLTRGFTKGDFVMCEVESGEVEKRGEIQELAFRVESRRKQR